MTVNPARADERRPAMNSGTVTPLATRRPGRRRLTAVAAVFGVLMSGGVAAGDHIGAPSCAPSAICSDDRGGPRIEADRVQKARETGHNALRGREHEANELLGWHGSDTNIGGDESDVLWADHIRTNQPRRQVDVLYGRGGDDSIYSASGRNTIHGGPGQDTITLRRGRGTLNCGAGIDTVYVPRFRRGSWRIRHCETVYFHVPTFPRLSADHTHDGRPDAGSS